MKLGHQKLPRLDSIKFMGRCRPADIFPDLRKNSSCFGLNNGSFSFGDVIEHVLNHTGRAHALISSWVASERSIKQVLRYFKNKRFLSVKFLLDRMFPNSRPDIFQYVVDNFGVDSIRVSYVHSKFCALYNEEWFFVIETSANLNKNRRLESFRITEDEKFVSFFRELFVNLFKVIKPHKCPRKAQGEKPTMLNKLPDIPPRKKLPSQKSSKSQDLELNFDLNLDLDLDLSNGTF